MYMLARLPDLVSSVKPVPPKLMALTVANGSGPSTVTPSAARWRTRRKLSAWASRSSVLMQYWSVAVARPIPMSASAVAVFSGAHTDTPITTSWAKPVATVLVPLTGSPVTDPAHTAVSSPAMNRIWAWYAAGNASVMLMTMPPAVQSWN